MTYALNPEAKPYATYADCPASPDCDYCGEGWEHPAGHTHEIYETREGASHRTADELADVFLDAVEFYAKPWRRPDDCPRDVEGWLDDPDAAQWLGECLGDGEAVLGDVGLSVYWDDGYVIERVTDPLGLGTREVLSPIERAQALGRAHGARDAETLCSHCTEGPELDRPAGVNVGTEGTVNCAACWDDLGWLPEPDLSASTVGRVIVTGRSQGGLTTDLGPWSSNASDAYCEAYRSARDETIRARCEP